MKDIFKKYFSEGIFGTGWRNAIITIVLAAAIYFANEIYDLLNHGPAVWNLRTPLDAALPVVTPFVVPYVSLDYVVYFSLIVFLLFRTKVFHSAALAMITAFLRQLLLLFLFPDRSDPSGSHRDRFVYPHDPERVRRRQALQRFSEPAYFGLHPSCHSLVPL